MNESDRTEELLRQILAVTAATAVRGMTLSEGAPLLDQLGVERAVIADVFGTGDGSVRAVLSQAKKTTPGKGKRKA